jgi:hypothetical protein
LFLFGCSHQGSERILRCVVKHRGPLGKFFQISELKESCQAPEHAEVVKIS